MSQVTDLTKTKWRFNTNITLQELGTFSISFSIIINHKIFYYDTLGITAFPEAITYTTTERIGDYSDIVYSPTSGWKATEYLTIWIDQGTDSINSELINFLYNNASLVNSENALNSNFELSIATGLEPWKKIILNTKEKYLNKDIKLVFNHTFPNVSLSGGEISGILNLNSANASFSDSNISGVMIQPSGLLNRATVNSVASDGLINNDIGLSNIVNQQCNGNTQYLTGVTLTAGKQFNITVPNGENDTITFHFSVDENGNTTIT